MIFPWIHNFFDFTKYPFTALIVVTNTIIFLFTYQANRHEQIKLTEKDILWFHEIVQAQEEIKSKKDLISITKKMIDLSYIENIFQNTSIPIHKKIEADYRMRKINKFAHELMNKNIHKFGFVPKEFNKVLKWITYQFMHANFIHIFSNMIIFIIFASFLEARLGGSSIIGIYLISGILGAYSFWLFSSKGVTPLIGSSASVSGMIGAYYITEQRKYIPFFYFLSVHHMGKIALPTVLILFIFFINDLVNFITESSLIPESIANVAHLGGFLGGILIGFFIKFNYSAIRLRNF